MPERDAAVIEVLLIALALAVDATVYSFSYGLLLRERRVPCSLWLALCVGVFQALMPLLGYAGGEAVSTLVEAWAPWIVFVVFLLLGGSVIRQSLCGSGDDRPAAAGPLGIWGLLLVGVATSIDALAIGVCMALGGIGGGRPGIGGLLLNVSLIGAVTFVCSLAAFHAARPLRHLPSKWLECGAGLLLIALGVFQLVR